MRLRDWEIDAIKRSAIETFGPDVVIRLFGSRVDDNRRGGDIDLHITLPGERDSGAAARFRRLLDRKIGEREIDVLLYAPGTAEGPVDLEAVRTGIVL